MRALGNTNCQLPILRMTNRHQPLFNARLIAAFAFILLARNEQAVAQVLPSVDKSKAIQFSQSAEISSSAKDFGFNPTKLKAIDRKLAAMVKAGETVGCSALVIKDDQEIFFGKWGESSRESATPIARDTIFRIYSMSKPITSIAVMQLVEQGKIELDAPVKKYLQDFENLTVLKKTRQQDRGTKNGFEEVAPKRDMTIRDLLRHTSGLTYGFFGDSEVDKRYRRAGILLLERDIKETVRKLGKIPLLNHPGSKFVYSVSTDVLGRVIEVASGQSFDAYLRENIFLPLQMDDTYFSLPAAKLERFATLYKPAKNRTLTPANPLQSLRFVSEANDFFSGGGGLCSTLDDYANFCKMLLQKGNFAGKQIVDASTIAEMFTNQLADIDQPPGQFKFGLGFKISPRGDYGWGGAAGTHFWVNPEKNLTILYMVQIMPYGNRKDRDFVRDAVYSALR
jgi:CubicO group peptidase (beta-lactamase class C family)